MADRADDTADLRVDERDGVLSVTLTRDAKLNAVNAGMFSAMRGAVDELEQRPDLRVLVYAAEGRYFTSGLDLGTLAMASTGAGLRQEYRTYHAWLDHIESVEKPVVLAVQARCLGLGVELGASCDFRLASTAATFELPEIAHLGIIPGSGAISRMTRIVGPHWTKWMVMAGQRVDADEARTMGFVHAVYPEAGFPALVHDFCARLAAMPAEALGLAKLGIDHAVTADRTASRDFDRVAQSFLFTTPEYRARIEPFEPRRPT